VDILYNDTVFYVSNIYLLTQANFPTENRALIKSIFPLEWNLNFMGRNFSFQGTELIIVTVSNSTYVNITLVFVIITLNYMNINCKLLEVCYYMQIETYQHTYSKQCFKILPAHNTYAFQDVIYKLSYLYTISKELSYFS